MAERTALFDRHRALGAHLVDFAGVELPQQYGSIQAEHLAVRRAAGLFDLSHMGRVAVRGPGAEAFLQGLLTNDLARIGPGQAQYTLLCREDAGILDDLVVYRLAAQDFQLVVNAANRAQDRAWLEAHAGPGVEIADRTREVSLIALQGPRAVEILGLLGFDLEQLAYFGFTDAASLAGKPVMVSRTGYTGEDGAEIFVDAAQATPVWDAILDAGRPLGLLPCGLGARDACRLEAALRLYGSDMDERTNPYEAGLGWTVKLSKGDFIGRRALAGIKEEGPGRELIGLNLKGRAIPRHGCQVMSAQNRLGVVTSGTYSFWLGQAIALAMVKRATAEPGSAVEVEVRGQRQPAQVVALPFYRGSVRPPATARS